MNALELILAAFAVVGLFRFSDALTRIARALEGLAKAVADD